MSELLACRNLTKRFGGIVALDAFEVTIPRGRLTGLIGPNGAGKTTLFNVVTGVYTPEEGTVRFDGDPITGRPPHEVCHAGIARTFQTPRPIEALTVEENLRVARRFGRRDGRPGDGDTPGGGFARRIAGGHGITGDGGDGITGDGDDASVPDHRRILEAVGLEAEASTDAGDLQMVEQKYVDLARALGTDPDLVLVDEIMAGLTPAEKDEMIDRIRRLHREFGVDFLVVEHDLRAIRSVSDVVVAMSEGRFVTEGSPGEVLDDRRVREAYVGT